ncbi:Gibberellin 2-beta-dioxygenase, partial [Linum grandiflorum]
NLSPPLFFPTLLCFHYYSVSHFYSVFPPLCSVTMVVLSRPAFDHFSSTIKTCKPTSPFFFPGIPVVDFSDPNSKFLIAKACKDFGFFKLTNHGISSETIRKLESLAVEFFSRPQSEKDAAGPPTPFGYGNKRIGPNGDIGWIEYLLLHSKTEIRNSPSNFRCAVREYVAAVKKMTMEVLEAMAEAIGIEPRNALSRLVDDEGSDSCLRLNHYPSCPEIVSVLRSNNTTGLQICLKDGTWVPVPPDQSSFFVIVGDALQVMTNGRFKSVKHRVMTDPAKSRMSMIYFAGPPLSEKIAALESIMEDGEESRYEEFTWSEYKQSAYKSRLADYRLGHFEKKNINKNEKFWL